MFPYRKPTADITLPCATALAYDYYYAPSKVERRTRYFQRSLNSITFARSQRRTYFGFKITSNCTVYTISNLLGS